MPDKTGSVEASVKGKFVYRHPRLTVLLPGTAIVDRIATHFVFCPPLEKEDKQKLKSNKREDEIKIDPRRDFVRGLGLINKEKMSMSHAILLLLCP